MNVVNRSRLPQFRTRIERYQGIRLYRILLVVIWFGFSATAFADAPTLTHLFPAGGQRGKTVVVTCAGKFTWPTKVSALGVRAVPLAESGKLQVTIPEDLTADRVWIRLYDKEGASVAQPFLIGNLKEIEEVEPNNKPREAHSVPETNVTVNGVLKDSEVDCFLVSLTAGQTLVAALDANTRIGSPMDSVMQIATLENIVVAENHDDFNIDPRIAFTPPKTGKYVVRIFAFPSTPNSTIRYNGGADHVYRLTLTTGPYATHALPLSASVTNLGTVDAAGWNIPAGVKLTVGPFGGTRLMDHQEFESLDDLRRASDSRIGFAFSPGFEIATRVRLSRYPMFTGPVSSNAAQPTALSIPSTVTGRLKIKRQSDQYQISLTKGQQFAVSVESRSLGITLDPVVKLVDPTGTVVAEIDDTAATRDSSLTHTAAHDGNYRLTVHDRFRGGGDRCWYLLTVRFDEPDFELSAAADAIVVPADKPAEFAIKVVRRGTAAEAVGPITVQAAGLPEGVTVAPVISETTGPTAAEVKLSIVSTGAPFSGPIRIVGKATVPRDLERFARTPPRLGVAFDSIWLTSIEKPK